MLFPGKDVDHAVEHMDAMLKEIATMDFVIRSAGRPRKRPDSPRPRRRKNKSTRITVSAGVAARSNRNSGPDDVARAADKALYKAKAAGRNQVCR